MPSVNLDALIRREDFEIKPEETLDASVSYAAKVNELESKAYFYNALRKPDFQRETTEWDPRRVATLIKTFVDGDLIPAVILWKNRDLLFVIDGSHRLSALIAWVQDDYGDGPRSQSFFENQITDEQKEIAHRTREIVHKEIGSYRAHQDAAASPERASPEVAARARRLASIAVQLQWVQGDASKAQESFIRINQQAAKITPEELVLIRKRAQANVIAARAIRKRATGHQYWSKFGVVEQGAIRGLAVDVHQMLFEPPPRSPIRSIEVSAGGSVDSGAALRMVYDLINLCIETPATSADERGEKTIEYLTRCRRVMRMILSNHPSSLGLHPAVYFYSWTGRQQPIQFLVIAQLVIDMDKAHRFDEFTRLRRKLESFLVSNQLMLQQLVRKFGSKLSGFKHLRGYYDDVLGLLKRGVDPGDAAEELKKDSRYSYLAPDETMGGKEFSAHVKAGTAMKGLIASAARCSICGGLLPFQAMSFDHRLRKEDGGLGVADNAALAHPYCNTGFKEGCLARGEAI